MSDHELDQQQYVEHLDERDAELTHLANRIEELEAKLAIVKKFDEDPPSVDLDVYSEDYKDGWYDCMQELKKHINREKGDG